MESPTPAQVRQTRKAVVPRMSQTKAAAVVYVSLRTWQSWEAGETAMPPGLFELFKIKTGAASAC